MFFEFLKMGKKIKIYGGNFTPSTFDYHGGAVWVKNQALGYFPHDDFTSNPRAFENHVAKMIESGLNVTIYEEKNLYIVSELQEVKR